MSRSQCAPFLYLNKYSRLRSYSSMAETAFNFSPFREVLIEQSEWQLK